MCSNLRCLVCLDVKSPVLCCSAATARLSRDAIQMLDQDPGESTTPDELSAVSSTVVSAQDPTSTAASDYTSETR